MDSQISSYSEKTISQAGGLSRIYPTNPFNPFPQTEIEQSIAQRFEKQVVLNPKKIAVDSGNHSFTYQSLNEAANKLAGTILSFRPDRQKPVALLMEHDGNLIAAILGILKAGNFYVPLDPADPYDRKNQILMDSQTEILLCSNKYIPLARELAIDQEHIVNVEGIIFSALPYEITTVKVTPDDLAFLLYTSGSTGKPKGVVQNHRNILHNVMKYTNNAHISEQDRLSLLSYCTFVASTADIFSALLNGGTVLPFDLKREGFVKFRDWLMGKQISIYHSVPTVYRHFVETLTGHESFPDLRLIRLGGEEVTRRDVETFKKYFAPDCMLCSGLGSTETNITRQLFLNKKTEFEESVLPVGFDVMGMEIQLREDTVNPNADGVGEIIVKSRYLSPGYWKNPELTKKLFSEDPEDNTSRIFQTGDLGCMRPDGILVHLGRKDFQIKIRGHRVEVAQIELELLKIPGIRETAAVGKKDKAGTQYLAAYFAPEPGFNPAPADLRKVLAETLPDYMVPSILVPLISLPLTATGKIDRLALADLEVTVERRSLQYNPPRDPLEIELVKIWEEMLSVNPVGIRDDFFELGGHSILALRLIEQINELTGIELPLATLFETTTIEGFANILREERTTRPRPSLVPIQTSGNHFPFFCIHDISGDTFIYRALSRHLGSDQPVYGLQAQFLNGNKVAAPNIEALAAGYLQEIRKVQPKGPYFLGGYSFGGIMAAEMAQQLLSTNEEAIVILFDSLAPGAFENLSVSAKLGYYTRKLRFNTGQVFGPGQIKYAGQKIREIKRRARKTLRNLFWRSSFVLDQKVGRPRFVKKPNLRVTTRMALNKYEPSPYSVKLVLFRTPKITGIGYVDPTLGWTRLAPKGMVIHEVSGDHSTILREPHVEGLARVLKPYLQARQD